MEITTLQDYVDQIGIFGAQIAGQMKLDGDDYTKYSYLDMQKNAKIVAAYLDKKKHLKKGGMAAVLSENRPEWFFAYLGIIYNGIWAVPLDAKLTDREVKNLVLDSGVRIIFLSRLMYENIQEVPEIMSHITEFIVFDPTPKILKDKKVISFAQVLETGAKLELKKATVKPEDVASLIYTSGTTGNPKGVMLTHRNFSHQVNVIPGWLHFDQSDTLLSVLPLHHTFEFSIELAVMSTGVSITYAESMKANKMLANISETNVTMMVGVPLLYEKIYDGIMRKIRAMSFPVKQIIMGLYHLVGALNKITNNKAGKAVFGFIRKKASLNNVRFMISGAAPLNQKVGKGYATLGMTLLNGYGLTETSPVIACNRMNIKIKNESVGRIFPHVEVRINKPDELNNGEILIKGPNVMKGYFNNKKATDEMIDKEGWLHTGDIGMMDHDGYLYITGRSKNMIVTSGGKNVYPEELEEYINNDEGVLESLVLGVPEGEHSMGEKIYAYVVPNYEYFDQMASVQGFKNTEENIAQYIEKHMREVNKYLQDYKKIMGHRVRVEEFPKTSTKKIKRYLFSGADYNNS
jgi:long-chain acyl-CoA synthetase